MVIVEWSYFTLMVKLQNITSDSPADRFKWVTLCERMPLKVVEKYANQYFWRV